MWVGFLIYVVFAIFVTSTIWSFCGARSRKNPIILLLVGFLVSAIGVFLIWATDNYADTIGLVCSKSTIITASECSLDKLLGGITGKFIEIGFAALGAGLMGLAFDIKTKGDLDLKKKITLGRIDRLKEREIQLNQEFDQLEKDLDGLQPSERVKRFRHLKNKKYSIFDDKLDADEEVEKWL